MVESMSKGNKVFVVTTGCYSDYSIKGIFSSKEKAEQYMVACRGSAACWDKDFNDIEEHILDQGLAEREHTRWRCGIMLDDGSLGEAVVAQQNWGLPENSHYVAERVPVYKGRGIVRVESVKSAEHALKLAAEKRQEWLRENKDKPRHA